MEMLVLSLIGTSAAGYLAWHAFSSCRDGSGCSGGGCSGCSGCKSGGNFKKE